MSARRQNEKKCGNWQDLPGGKRRYWYELTGRNGWKARYVKEVDASEQTASFYQEICDHLGNLVEVHEKFPVDKGQRKA